MAWEKVKLKEVTHTLKGYAFKSKFYVDDGVPVVRASDFTSDSISEDNLVYYPHKAIDSYSKYILHCDDVLVQTVGSWDFNPDSVVGKVVRVPRELDEALLNQNIVKLISDDLQMLDNKFLYYRLKCSDFAKHNIGNAVGAANQASITLKTIGEFTFYLPDIKVQRKIADILSAYDEFIENNRRQVRLLEEAAQRLYKEWFVKFHFPGWEETKMVDGLPVGWKKQPFKNLVHVIRGRSYSSEELDDNKGSYLINLKNIQPYGGYKFGEEKLYTGAYSQEQCVKGGDIVMSVTDMTAERRLIGHVARIPHLSKTAVISMDLIKLLPQGRIDPNYFYAMLRYSNKGVEFGQYATGANVLHLKPDNIGLIDLVIPTDDLQIQFGKLVQVIFEKIELIYSQIQLLQEARDRLLPRLMREGS